jgi:DNA-binding NtrC family response regulator
MTDEDGQRLQRYEWPGNILQNVIERAVILSKGDRLRLDLALANAPAVTASPASPIEDMPDTILTDREWRERERGNLMNALKRAEGRVYGAGGAADLRGVKPTTLVSRLRALKINPQDPR